MDSQSIRYAVTTRFLEDLLCQENVGEILRRLLQIFSDPRAWDYSLREISFPGDTRTFLYQEIEEGCLYALILNDRNTYIMCSLVEDRNFSKCDYVLPRSLKEVIDYEEDSVEISRIPSVIEGYSDSKLERLGIPRNMISWLREQKGDEEFFKSAQRVFIPSLFNSLKQLTKHLPFDEIQSGVEASESEEEQYGRVRVKSQQSLNLMLNSSLTSWRMHLSSSQFDLVKRNYTGSLLIRGCAGTGKTVIALHRAARLSSILPEGKKVLLTFYNRHLENWYKTYLSKVCPEDCFEKVEISTIGNWVWEYLKQCDCLPKRIIYEWKDLEPYWESARREVLKDAEKLLPLRMCLKEYVLIYLFKGTKTKEEYMRAKRCERKRSLTMAQKEQIWEIITRYKEYIRMADVMDPYLAMVLCEQLLEKEESPKYEAIVVDEYQNLNTGALRLIRKLAGKPHGNDLFLCGDIRQRINQTVYEINTSLLDCGIDVRKRTYTMNLNYRTPEQILSFASSVLPEDERDVLPESLLEGARPEINSFESEEEENEYIIKKIKDLLNSDVRMEDICILCHHRDEIERMTAYMDENKVNYYNIQKMQESSEKRGVRICTIHKIQGLEYKYVFIAGLTEASTSRRLNEVPNASEKEKRRIMQRERNLIYVAITRACRGVFVTCSGTPSPLIQWP